LTTTAARIGFVGLGRMGTPMAHHLHAAGHRLTVHDLAAAATQAFVAAHPGAAVAADGDDFARCDVVITMLPDSDAVESAVLGIDGRPGLALLLPPGAVVVDMSSSQPLRSRALAAALLARGLRYLDAPVSGGVRRAVDGTLSVMVGGDAAEFERCRPLLATMGRQITHVGPAGAGHAVKALNNYVSAAGLVATCEAMLAAQAFGVDPELAVEVFNQSTGRNNTTENKARQFMLSGRFNSGFSLALMAKDLGIAEALGRDLGSPMPLAAPVLATWQAAAAALASSADHTEMYRYLQQLRR